MPLQKDLLKIKADDYAHQIYKLCHKLPDHEKFGLTSQLRRAGLSIPLNIIEGYARQSIKSEAQFLLISFGSLKESQYILNFSVAENYIGAEEANETLQLGEELARLIWAKVQRYKAQVQNN